MKQQNFQAKQIKINIANAYKLYKEDNIQKQKDQKYSQNVLPQNQIPIQAKVDGNNLSQTKFKLNVKINSNDKSKLIHKVYGSDGRVQTFQTPRSAISSTHISSTIKQKQNFPIKNLRKSDDYQIFTPKSLIKKERASSLMSEQVLEFSQKVKEEQNRQVLSTNRQKYQNQNMVSKIKCFLQNLSNRKDSNMLFKNQLLKNKYSKTDQSLNQNVKTIHHHQSQDQNEEFELDNQRQPSYRINNFMLQQIQIKTNRSNQADQIVLSPKKQQSQSQDNSPYFQQHNQDLKIPLEFPEPKFSIGNQHSNQQHIFQDDLQDRKYQKFSENRKLSMYDAITNYENLLSENKLSDIIKGKSHENSSPRNASQQKQIADTNQFKIKLLQNLKDQMEVQTDLSNRFQNPLKANRQEKRISQMISAKLVPNTVSSKDLQNICENRQVLKKKAFSSLQQFLESQLPYEKILQRQQQEIQIEKTLRKSIRLIVKSKNSPSHSRSNSPSPIRQEVQEFTPISNFNFDENFQSLSQIKTQNNLNHPLSPKKSLRVSLELNKNTFQNEYIHNQQREVNSSLEEFQQQQQQNKYQNHNQQLIFKTSKSVSNVAKIESSSKKEIDSPTKKQNLLFNYIPSSMQKKKFDLEKNIKIIKFKSLLSFAEQSNQAIFEIEKNQNLKNVIDENIKKLSPYKQKINSKIFRFDTNNSEPDYYQNTENQEISCYSPQSNQKYK